MRYKDMIDTLQTLSPDIETRAASKRTMNLVVSILRDAVTSGDDITLPKFGRLAPKRFASRRVVSPLIPGGECIIPERTQVKFTPYERLKKDLNKEA